MHDGDPDVLTGRTTSNEPLGRPPRQSSPPPSPLERRSEDLVRLLKELGDAPKPRLVHDLRTTIRRVETLLPDANGDPQRKVRKQLDRVRRRAGKVRDVDVHLKALATLPRTVAAEVRDDLRQALEKTRDKRVKRLARTIGGARDRGVVKRLRQAVVHAATGTHGATSDPERALSEVLDGFATARHAAEPLGAESLHDFRIATKRLRYRAEILPGPEAAKAVTELKRVQDAIGDWHDWLTLAARAEKELDGRGASGPRGGPQLLAAIRTRTDALFIKAIETVERVGRRLEKARPAPRRKGVRRVTGSALPALPRSAGARA